jgi:hypothetical protein
MSVCSAAIIEIKETVAGYAVFVMDEKQWSGAVEQRDPRFVKAG